VARRRSRQRRDEDGLDRVQAVLGLVEDDARRRAEDLVGDGRFNMGRSLLITGAILGSDVRIVTPEELRPPADVIERAEALAADSGARITISDDVAAVEGSDFVHTDVWVSMGESKDVWAERAKLLEPYQVNTALLERTGNAKVEFMHCLPAFHDRGTTVGEELFRTTGMTALEVTDEVFESRYSNVFDQAENRLHTIKAVLVATLGG
jgi:ornithine carbamoyltransferase